MRIGGLASGMDIDQMVKDLMNAERIPLNKMLQQKQTFEWQQEDYRSINLSLSSFRDTAFDIRLQSSFIANEANSTNDSAIKGTATVSSVQGSYEVEVVTLAKSAKITSENTVLNQSGTAAKASDLVLTSGAASETFQVTSTDGTNTLTASITVTDQHTFKDVANMIASAVDDTTGESLKLRANFDDTTSRFFFSSKEMGGNDQISIVDNASAFVAGAIMAGATTQTGGNTYQATGTFGEITYDGITVNNLTTNSTTINGLKLDFYQEGQSATIAVQSNTQPVLDKITSFVEEYNKIIEEAEKEFFEKRYREYTPLTEQQKESMSDKEIELWEEKARSGMLKGDRMLGDMISDLRRSLMDKTGLPPTQLTLLSEIGISTGSYQNRGKLFINETKLIKALAEKPEEVMELFTGKNGVDGIGNKLYDKVNNHINRLSDKAGSPKGTLVDNSTISKKLRDLDTRIDTFEDRLIQVEDRYWSQFSAMESALNELNAQSAWMMSNMFGA
jgi:flagellar hook-associated protein 2